MARIAEEEIERLKKEVDLAELVGKAGVELKKAGADLVGRCPFHEDDTPSLVVSPHKGLWHCMGACQAGGSVIDWVMRAEKVSFRHAVELLRDGDARSCLGRGTRSTVRQLSPPVAREASDEELLCQVVDYYHARLKESPEALAYLARRRVDDPAAIGTFGLGYCDRTLGLRIADKTDPRRCRDAGRPATGRHLPCLGPRAPRRLADDPGDRRLRGASPSSTGARSQAGRAPARHCTSTCPAPTAACGTRRRSRPRGRSCSPRA